MMVKKVSPYGRISDGPKPLEEQTISGRVGRPDHGTTAVSYRSPDAQGIR
jgi:hypothetical protein